MIKLSPIKKIYILSFSAIIILLSTVVFFIYPAYLKIIEINKRTYEDRLQIAILQQQRSNIEKSKQEYDEIKNEIENISKIFVAKENVLDLVDTFESVAKKNSLTQNLNIYNLDQITQNSFYFDLATVGEWPSQMNYLNDLEKLDIYVTIDDLKFSYTNNLVSMSFRATMYPIPD